MLGKKKTLVGIVAPSSIVPRIELAMGVERLIAAQFIPQIHPLTESRHFLFAGTHEERTQAFLEFAFDPDIEVIWCARGGYGAGHLLEALEKATPRILKKGIKKLLVGFSDATIVQNFVRERWGWSTLHAATPGLGTIQKLSSREWNLTSQWIHGQTAENPYWEKARLTWIGKKPSREIRGQIVGGNLSLLVSSLGTAFTPKFRGKIVFIEEVSENWGRIDQRILQLRQSGMFNGVRAIVLGNFLNCQDSPPTCLKQRPPQRLLKTMGVQKFFKNTPKAFLGPLRPKISEAKALQEIFTALGHKLRIPIAKGFPAGHGPDCGPLPLGANVRLTPQGFLKLDAWDWLKRS